MATKQAQIDAKLKVGATRDKPYAPDEKHPLVDSRKQQLDIGQIVTTASYHTKSKHPPNTVAMSILLELAKPDTVQKQIGNTLFIIHKDKAPNRGMMRALNADTANRYAQNAREFVMWAYQQGFDQLATHFSGDDTLRIIRFIAKNSPIEGMGYNAYQLPDKSYLVTLTLGPARDQGATP